MKQYFQSFDYYTEPYREIRNPKSTRVIVWGHVDRGQGQGIRWKSVYKWQRSSRCDFRLRVLKFSSAWLNSTLCVKACGFQAGFYYISWSLTVQSALFSVFHPWGYRFIGSVWGFEDFLRVLSSSRYCYNDDRFWSVCRLEPDMVFSHHYFAKRGNNGKSIHKSLSWYTV